MVAQDFPENWVRELGLAKKLQNKLFFSDS